MMTLSIRNDIANSVKGECGEDICSEVEYVVLTLPNGRRWAHPESFEVVSIGYDEFPFRYPNKAEAATVRLLLQQLQEELDAGALKLDDWVEIDPVYGSDSWDSECEWRLAQLDKDR